MRERSAARRSAMRQARLLRSSLATRLLAGGLVFTAVVIASVSSFLLVSRSQQMQNGALSNADNRAGVAAQLIARVTEPQAAYAAAGLAALPRLQSALSGTQPEAALTEALTGTQAVAVPGLNVVVFDTLGNVLYTSEAREAAHVTASDDSVQAAMALGSRPGCGLAAVAASAVAACPALAEGTELLSTSAPAFDVAAPV
ncbi:MAG: hypothetical protein JO152_16520, partial [Mycobacteriaceae bacterium]|nr:hypothetical protein [Mycobacteriaceae bacterium]